MARNRPLRTEAPTSDALFSTAALERSLRRRKRLEIQESMACMNLPAPVAKD